MGFLLVAFSVQFGRKILQFKTITFAAENCNGSIDFSSKKQNLAFGATEKAKQDVQ